MIFKLFIQGKDEFYKEVPTFKDENVSYKAKITDAEELESIYNDTTNNFTIPASDVTNNLFRYWFEAGYVGDDFFDIKETFNAFIELNTIPYKAGKVKLLGIDSEDGLIKNYKISFSGNLIGLDKVFGETKLSDLDYSKAAFDYSHLNLKNLIQSPFDFTNIDGQTHPNLMIIPPMFLTDRNLMYDAGGGLGTNFQDITAKAYALTDAEIRPAITVYEVIKAIENKFGITFNRREGSDYNNDIFSSSTFKNLYLWLNGQEQETLFNWTAMKATNFNNSTGQPVHTLPPDLSADAFSLLEDGTFRLRMNYDIYNANPIPTPQLDNGYATWYRSVLLSVNNPTNAEYKVRVVDINRGVIVNEPEWTTDINKSYLTINYSGINVKASRANFGNYEDRYKFEIIKRGGGTLNYTFRVQNYFDEDSASIIHKTSTTSYIGTIPNLFDVGLNMPDITVSDFFKGLLKAFKLVIRPTEENHFIVQTLNDYYATGNILNLTPHLDLKRVSIKTRSNYGIINFKLKESDLVIQKNFREMSSLTGSDYGNLNINFPTLDGKKDIEVPFTNFLMTSLPSANTYKFMASLHQEEDDGEYKASNKGVFLFYYNGQESLPKNVWLTGVGATSQVNSFPKISIANISQGRMLDSFSFREENLPDGSGQSTSVNLFSRYWSKWVRTLYDRDARVVEYEGELDYHTVNKLSLNSKIVVGNNLYNINDYDLNLTDYKVKISLLSNIDHKDTDDRVKDIEDGKVFTYPSNAITERFYLGEYSDWKITKIDIGSDIDWIWFDESNPTENNVMFKNVEEVSFTIGGKLSSVLNPRAMDLKFTNTKTNETFTVNINQP